MLHDVLGAEALLGCCFWQEFWPPQVSKIATLMTFLAIPFKMEAVRSPLEHIKESQVGATRPLAIHQMALVVEHF